MKERKLKNKDNYDVTLTRIEQTDENKILSTATVSGTEANQRYGPLMCVCVCSSYWSVCCLSAGG